MNNNAITVTANTIMNNKKGAFIKKSLIVAEKRHYRYRSITASYLLSPQYNR